MATFGPNAAKAGTFRGVNAALKGRRFRIGVHRASLFAALHEAVLARGLPIHTGRAITDSRLSGTRRHLQFQDGGESAGFDLVVDAQGARTPLAIRTWRQLDRVGAGSRARKFNGLASPCFQRLFRGPERADILAARTFCYGPQSRAWGCLS